MSSRRPGRTRRGERGFTLVEVMMAIALLGVATGVITKVFLGGYQVWKWNYDSLLLQRNVRMTMAMITRALREARPYTVAITSPAGGPQFSEIAFMDIRGQGWIFRQEGRRIIAVMPPSAGGAFSSTSLLASDIDALSFVYPNFQDTSLIDIGITARKVPYQRAPNPIIIQLVERTMLRNP